MSIRDYRDFVMIADRVEAGPTGVVQEFEVQVFDSPVGQGDQRETVRVPDSLPAQIRSLERRSLDDDVVSQMDLGESLAALLLPQAASRQQASQCDSSNESSRSDASRIDSDEARLKAMVAIHWQAQPRRNFD